MCIHLCTQPAGRCVLSTCTHVCMCLRVINVVGIRFFCSSLLQLDLLRSWVDFKEGKLGYPEEPGNDTILKINKATPEGCPSLLVAPWNDCRSEQTLTTGSRERARAGNDGRIPLIFPHQCSLSRVTAALGCALSQVLGWGPTKSCQDSQQERSIAGSNAISQGLFSCPPHPHWTVSLTQQRAGLSQPLVYPYCLGVLDEYQLNY